jgi:hypothetical protein
MLTTTICLCDVQLSITWLTHHLVNTRRYTADVHWIFSTLLLQACAACTAALDAEQDGAARDDQVLLQLSVLERLLSLIPQEVG